MWSFAALCDEFCVSARLFLKLGLDPSRETVLHLFEQIRRAYPRMSRLRRREDGGLVLEDEGDEERGRRYVRIDSNALKFGIYGPSNQRSVQRFGELIFTQAPPQLSLSDLDYDYLDVVFAFDLEYRGNHDELVADTLLPDHPLLRVLTSDGQRVIDCQPFFGVALGGECDRQVYFEIKGRTSTYEVRSGEFEPAPLSVHLTARRYWGFGDPHALVEVFNDLLATGEQYAADRVVPLVIKPLAAAIASRR
jgi:hypothetical protein